LTCIIGTHADHRFGHLATGRWLRRFEAISCLRSARWTRNMQAGRGDYRSVSQLHRCIPTSQSFNPCQKGLLPWSRCQKPENIRVVSSLDKHRGSLTDRSL